MGATWCSLRALSRRGVWGTGNEMPAPPRARHGRDPERSGEGQGDAWLERREEDWSDRKIAEACGVHPETVGIVRRLSESDSGPAQPRVGKDGRSYKPPAPRAKPAPKTKPQPAAPPPAAPPPAPPRARSETRNAAGLLSHRSRSTDAHVQRARPIYRSHSLPEPVRISAFAEESR